MAHTHRPGQHVDVRALTVGSRWTHRRERLGEWVRDRLWFIPMLLVLWGILTAVVVAYPDVVGLPRHLGGGHAVRTTTADTILGVMSSSMLTFVGVVFAITLVGLQLASSQLSPRVIRTLHDLLLRIARMPTPTGLHVDAAGRVRLVEPTYSWAHLVLRDQATVGFAGLATTPDRLGLG